MSFLELNGTSLYDLTEQLPWLECGFTQEQSAMLRSLEAKIDSLIVDPFWVKFKRIKDLARVPTRAYDSAGYDLFPCESGTIMPGETKRIELGITSSFPFGYAAIVDDRSSTGLRNLTHLAGVIDSPYRGPWAVIMHNIDAENASPFDYSPEKAIAQVLFLKVESAKPIELGEDEDHDDSERGERGFGSSDK